MAELLVTGGAGFIGANFVRFWRQRHPADGIVVLDALTYAGNRASLDGIAEVTFVHGDIRERALVERLLREHEIDTLVHFAAESHVDRSILGPAAFVKTNVLGTQALLDAARAMWLGQGNRGGSGRPHRFHHVSTDEVFGSLGPDDPAVTEATPYAPNSPYAASKAAADHLVRAAHRTYGLQVTTSHCSNNYGPYQFPEKLIPRLLLSALHGQPLPIYGDGLNRRDWLHVEDHCRAIELILARGTVGECYNVGGGEELDNLTLAHLLCGLIDHAEVAQRFPDAPAASASLIRHVSDRLGHDRRYAIDAGKAERELGYAPTRDFAGGLAETVDWYLANEAWWRESAAE